MLICCGAPASSAMPSAAHRLGETVPAALRSGVRPAAVANPRGVPNAAVVQHTLAAYAAAVAEADAAGGAPAAPADLKKEERTNRGVPAPAQRSPGIDIFVVC